MAEKLFLEDLFVGWTFASVGSLTLEEAKLKAFAREFDPQPFHLDDEAAKDTMFNGLAASGWHTAALTMKLLVSFGPPIAGGIIGAGGELKWPRPLRAGDTIRLTCEVVELRASSSRPQGRVKMRITTLNQQDDPVQVFVADMIVPSRAPAPSG